MPLPRLFTFFSFVLLVAASAGAAEVAEPPAPLKRLLLVSVTRGFRHASIPVAEAALEELGRGSGRFHLDFLRGAVVMGMEPDD